MPDWALGVALICVAFFGGIGIMYRFLPESAKGGKRRLDAESAERLEMLESKVQELEQGQHRLAELEERVDFAERLLARQNEAERLAPPRN
jgi:Tfp pilus assembly protein PilO